MKQFSSVFFAIFLCLSSLTMVAFANNVADKSSVAILSPNYTNKNSAIVNVQVTENEAKIKELLARSGDSKEWYSILDTKQITITKDGMVYVKSTFEDDSVLEVSQYIECFDKAKPTLTVTEISSNNLLITAKDSISGISTIYINDESFSYGDFDTINEEGTIVTLKHKYNNSKDNLLIQAEDNAGNLSSETTKGKEANNNNNLSSSNNETTAETGSVGNAKIEIVTPEWTNKKETFVKVNVSGNNIDSISAKTERNGTYTSIKSTMDVRITKNTDVYIRVVDVNGKETIYSEYIECFDNQVPYVSIVQNGKKITISAEDSMSGIQTLYVNGSPLSETTQTIDVTEFTSYVYAQSRDKAGNISETKGLNVNLSVLTDRNSQSTSSSSTTEPTENGATTKQKIYNINIGDKDYTIDDLKQAGIPVYIFTDVSDQQLEDISRQLETLYIQKQPKEQEKPKEEPKEEPIIDNVNEGLEEKPIKAENENKSNKGTLIKFFIFIFIAIVAISFVMFFVAKSKARKNRKNDGDLYENMDENDLFDNAFSDEDLEE